MKGKKTIKYIRSNLVSVALAVGAIVLAVLGIDQWWVFLLVLILVV